MFKSPTSLLKARSVAIVGASERAVWSTNLWTNLKEYGFDGPVYPINPARDEIWDVECFPDFASLPEPVDLALVVIPAEPALAALEEGAAHGLKAALVFSAKIGEGDDEEDIARGEALAALCDRSGLRACGPNCMGAASLHNRLIVHPHPTMRTLEPGSVGLVLQSGGAAHNWVHWATERGIKFSHVITSGNEIDLTLADYVNYLVDDENTQTISLFIEAIRRPGDFMAAAARALEAGKPIVALKTGRNEASRQSALSHTGAVCGDFDAYLAMCERYGIVNCRTYEEMVETTLAFQGGRIPQGRRMALVTISGGIVDLLHDYIEDLGAQVPAFGNKTVQRLEERVKHGISVSNPLDAGGGGMFLPHIAAPICEAVMEDDDIDMVAWTMRLPMTEAQAPDPTPLLDVFEKSEKPAFAFERLTYRVTDTGRAYQEKIGVPFLQGLDLTLRTLDNLGFYGERNGRTVPALPKPTGKKDNCNEGNLVSALAGYGVTEPKNSFVTSGDEAIAAAQEIGFPVALKIVSPEFSHKTEVGGVALDLRSETEVADAVKALAEATSSAGGSLSGFLVQEMVSGVEAIVGVREDEFYGPVLLLGAGGILVELAQDTAFRMLPVEPDDVHAMLGELKLSQLLAGVRGRPPGDKDALVAAVCALSQFYLDHRDWLAEIEINPLMVLEEGGGVRAVDIRAVPR